MSNTAKDHSLAPLYPGCEQGIAGFGPNRPRPHPSQQLFDRAIAISLALFLKRYGCKVSISAGHPDQLLVRHAWFLVSIDQRFCTTLLHSFLSADPEILIGEGFMTERWHVLEGDLEDVLSVLWNIARSQTIVASLRKVVNHRRFARWQTNSPAQARANIQRHYDDENPDNLVFRYMLGEVPCYSAAIFADDGYDLETAQNRKIDMISQKLAVKEGDKVLD